ncbi:hypothetical protein GLOIN_2v1138743 [Rhizophagus irregularis DAOM 181602=DAOM 197198]|uniref:Protein kinase domain-containing protein n=1 Tax=Rhizophagus irregularis (strain DAOM 181602 / DAOM 197198 / MUCL 43194) TaxID=747089 RepID=A0A2P4QVT9_RHIID|nr:hypothetical protein GLOIN_2v1138743 [Rhizophagus irregularis DAOM 181602=DAOM 197198]POG81761.1 hypothetical protein GLOIN_2v1138743 [Rhizophagus irregularis DAOM 181602=DAOM 197198]|eukprot:XP_025188627.1 hypothetical protein GLOIN_2v1138743 [Rhizophagus irregularis DAOM 181602=DAOM 197198]
MCCVTRRSYSIKKVTRSFFFPKKLTSHLLTMNKSKFNKVWICRKCKQINTGIKWCHTCNSNHFKNNFKNWTSGNDDIDKFLQNIQLSADNNFKVLEWIPYERFYNIEYIARGGFGTVYKAIWIDGYIRERDNKNQNWKRSGQYTFVALKSLNYSESVIPKILNEVRYSHTFTIII